MKTKKILWWLAIASFGIMVPFMAPYFTLDPAGSRVPVAPGTVQYPALLAHILFAFIALVSGFLQFADRIRLRNPKLHRNLGKAYVASVFLSGLMSLVPLSCIENFAKAASFLALAILWLFTSWKGYRAAVKHRIEEHRVWMVRSFGMTLVAVSGRLVVPLLLLAYYVLHGFSLPEGREKMVEEVLNANLWVGIVLNFAIVEWIVLRRMKGNQASGR
ncbi:DUF2306 domain-containing protein [Cohnella sp. CFH 77786]|uniref:DUF2306 domain-containing protein n=1 Tax=Cohnella sp. CFH 77786 TaxID=2662265 RepID=UPI001C60F880|nr:DUF2306 domain-containing protein [Cohnella sp. CFH 77786]MBW5448866.1 DUF2306 domain-containing protein [Cohnella sp. CFH 77786]